MLLLNCMCHVCMLITFSLMYSSLLLRPVDKVLVIMDNGILLLVEYQVYVSFQSGGFIEVVFVVCYV